MSTKRQNLKGSKINVSVIIPVHNRQKDLMNLMNCLGEQLVNDFEFEVIVIDDHSDEPVDQFLVKTDYPQLKIKTFYNSSILGAAFSKNIGANNASGKYLWFLDSDTLVENKKLIKKLFELVESNELIVTGGITEVVNGKKLIIDHTYLSSGVVIKKHSSISTYKQKDVGMLASTSLFVSRKVFEKIGGFNSSFVRDEDTDLCLRLKSFGYRFIQSQETVCHHLFSMTGREKSFESQFNSFNTYLQGLLDSRLELLRNISVFYFFFLPLFDLINLLKLIYMSLFDDFSARIFIFVNRSTGKRTTIYSLVYIGFSQLLKNYWKSFLIGSRSISKNLFVETFISSRAFYWYKLLPSILKKVLVFFLGKFTSSKVLENKIEKLTLFLTDGCNLSCSHCFATDKDVKIKGLLRKRDYARLFQGMSSHNYKLHITGGEPTLHPDFLDIIEMAATLGNCHECTIFTNGTNSEIISELFKSRSLLKMRVNIQLSLDGRSEFHDVFRGRKGNFEETMNIVNKFSVMKKNNLNLREVIINTSINEDNEKEIDLLVNYLKDKDVLHYFNFTRSKNILIENEVWGPTSFDKALSLERREKMFNLLDEKKWGKEKGNLLIRANRAILAALIQIEKGVKYKCVAGIKNLTILPNGEIAKCEVLKTKGNLTDYDFNIPLFLRSTLNKTYHGTDLGCACLHDCGVSNSIIYNKLFLENFLNK